MFTTKPWGFERLLVHTDKYAAKILFVFPGKRLSRQYHKIKKESLIYLSGDGYVECDNADGRWRVNLKENGRLTLGPGDIHRICAYEETHIELLEISTSEIDDGVRLEDDYGRVAERVKSQNKTGLEVQSTSMTVEECDELCRSLAARQKEDTILIKDDLS